jgi:hypothetical protein
MEFKSWSAIRRTGRPTARSVRNACAAALWLVSACASQPAPPPQNAVKGDRLTIAPDQALGWIGIAPRADRDPDDWVPAGAQAVLVPMPVEGLAAGATLSAIDTAGRTTQLGGAAATKVPYGCDGNQLDVLAFTGSKLTPGPVWLLPPSAPASWRPSPLAIVSPVAATEARRRDTVGPLSLELERTDAMRGTLAIARDGRVVHRTAITRSLMDGADPDPLDFQQPGVAIPVPVAAWSLVDNGPILLVLRVQSYEGMHLAAILVESDSAREVAALATYLYRCAF